MAKSGQDKPGLKVVSGGMGGADRAVLRKPDLVDRVVAASGQKKNAVKEVVEAVLAEMGKALDRGEELAVPPLGRLRLAKRKDKEGGDLMTLRLRRLTEVGGGKGNGGGKAKPADTGLADNGDDS